MRAASALLSSVLISFLFPYFYQDGSQCTLRPRVSRLVRATISFSKKLADHIAAIKYFMCEYTLTRHPTLPGEHYRLLRSLLFQRRDRENGTESVASGAGLDHYRAGQC
jgi:hypothetical protein